MSRFVQTSSFPRSPPETRGFTLVEIMVSITIGIIILAAVIQIFSSSRATYSLEEGFARVQENARFAMAALARDVRMAGYAGCVNINRTASAGAIFTVTNNLNNPTAFEANFAAGTHLRGHDYNGSDWSPGLPTFFGADEVRPDSDVLVIRHAADFSARITKEMPTTSATIHIEKNSGLNIGDIMIVTDCQQADIFQITSGKPNNGTLGHNKGENASPGNSTQTLSQSYDTDAEVLRFVTRVYFIGNDDDDGGEPALMVRELGGGVMQPGRALAGGVESMHIVYGEDTTGDGSADLYRLPASVTKWTRVVSVRVGLLLRTPDQTGVDVDTASYDVLGDTNNAHDDFGPTNDRRQRRVFTSTVQLRNQRTD